MISEIDFTAEFHQSFITGGGITIDCHCGKEHVAVDTETYDFDEDERDCIIEDAESNRNIVLQYETDSIEYIEIDGKLFVVDCDCQGYKKYIKFIVANRHRITDFLLMVSDKIQDLAEQEKTLDRLKNAHR